VYARLLTWSLRHRRWRHAINIVTMMFTIAVVMVFVSVMSELVRYAHKSKDREYYRMLVFPKLLALGSPTDGLPITLGTLLKEIPGAEYVQHVRAIGGRHPNGATYAIIGEEEHSMRFNRDFFPVEPDVLEAWKATTPLGAVVTEATARDLNLEVGQEAEIPTAFGPLEIKVVGLSHNALIGQRIAVHFDYLSRFAGNTGLCSYRIYTKPADFENVAHAVNERTRTTASPAQAVSDAEFAGRWAKEAALVPAVLGFLGIFLVFTTALTLANSAAIAIRERRTEMATMRVIGYRRGTIVRLMLGEVMIVGLVGGVLAVGVTWFLFRNGVQLTPGASKLLQAVTISPLAMIVGLVVSILIPLAGALPSALISIRVPLVSALRDTA
jgi:cell division protein FtsX